MAALTVGVWLSMRVARWVTETAGALGHNGAAEPVREMVQEVLAEHRTDESPIVQAFQEAVDAEEAEETVSVA